MKYNPYHGNRLRSPHDAYEVKKQRSRDRYAAAQLTINPLWLHNKILRDLVHLYGTGVEIPVHQFERRKFDIKVFKEEKISEGRLMYYYDIYKISITPNKNIVIWKI